MVWQERYDIRIELKDILRPELMEATRAYAVANSLSPITVCSRVHDIMNERIQEWIYHRYLFECLSGNIFL